MHLWDTKPHLFNSVSFTIQIVLYDLDSKFIVIQRAIQKESLGMGSNSG